jgi:tRNA G18 (ribose-2'-O)-methylase SpoU
VAPESLLREVVGFPFHHGAMAAGRRATPLGLDEMLSGKPLESLLRLIVCPKITNQENMGLVFRTAAGFGVDSVLLGQWCCDPFSRRCLRVSMGAVFHVPFVTTRDFLADLRQLKDRWGVQLVAAVLDDRAEPLSEVKWPPRVGLLLGNEFEGLPGDCLALCDHRATIPMRPRVDSLNLGVAAGIFVYEMTRAARPA